MEKNYSFSVFNEYSKEGIAQAIKSISEYNSKYITVCVGSDLVLGDSLGPLVGTLLQKNNYKSYLYGTLNNPVTAKEVNYINAYVSKMHPQYKMLAVDACVGKSEDVGIIKVMKGSLKPGLGVNKNLSPIGDISIIGVVAEKSGKNFCLYNLTRLNLVYKMAEVISEGIALYNKEFKGGVV